MARSRDRTSLLVTILSPFTPAPDNSPGILGLPVDCRPGATFGGHTMPLPPPTHGAGEPPHPRGRRVSRLRARNREPSDKRVRVGRRGAPFCRFYFGAADMPAIRIAAQMVDNTRTTSRYFAQNSDLPTLFAGFQSERHIHVHYFSPLFSQAVRQL